MGSWIEGFEADATAMRSSSISKKSSWILTKLGARDRTQLVILAYKSGLVTMA